MSLTGRILHQARAVQDARASVLCRDRGCRGTSGRHSTLPTAPHIFRDLAHETSEPLIIKNSPVTGRTGDAVVGLTRTRGQSPPDGAQYAGTRSRTVRVE